MKRFLRTPLVMSVRFLFLILLPLTVTMEQEYCMPEDYTNVAIPFRMVYEGKFNLEKSYIYIYWFLMFPCHFCSNFSYP
jgi:hypothetical protein